MIFKRTTAHQKITAIAVESPELAMAIGVKARGLATESATDAHADDVAVLQKSESVFV
jgi:hypothetical protein